MITLQSPVDAEHLRRVIEKQPNCLVRAGIDGILLAVNDAALGLLGARETADVLGTTLTARIVPEDRALWDEFAAAVAADSARSLECDLTDLAGARRRVLFHGVPLLDHPDGVPSMILGARDVSALRGLETSHEVHAHRSPPESGPLVDQVQRLQGERDQFEKLLKSGRAHLEVQRAQLATMAAERQTLEAQLAQRDAAHQRAIDEQSEVQRTLVEQHQREQELAAQAVQQQVDDLRARLTEAVAEQQRVEAQLAQRDAAHQRAIDEQSEVQRTLVEQRQREQELAAQAVQQQVDDLRARLTEAVAEQQRVEAQLAQRDVAHQRAIDEQAEVHRTLIEQHQREQELTAQAVQQQVDDLRARLADAAAEQQRVETQLAQRDVAHQRAIDEQAEVHRALIEQHRREQELAAQAVQQQADDLRAQLTEMAATQRRLETQLAQRDVEFIEELAAERVRVDEVLGASALKHRQMAQDLADRGVELHYMELTAKQLAPLAVAGRLALEVGVELRRVVEAMDAQTAFLLADCPPEAPHRDAVEALRGDAIRARSLTSQIEHAHAVTETENFSFQS